MLIGSIEGLEGESTMRYVNLEGQYRIDYSVSITFTLDGESVEVYPTFLQELETAFPGNRIMQIKHLRGVKLNGNIMSLRFAKNIIDWYHGNK